MNKIGIEHIFFISNPVNFIIAHEIIKRDNLCNVTLFIVNKNKKSINDCLFNNLKVKKINIFFTKKLTSFHLTVLSIVRLFLFRLNNFNKYQIYYGDFRWNFISLINLVLNPINISVIDDGLDSIFFKQEKKNYGFEKYNYTSELYIPNLKKIIFFQKKKIKKSNKKIYKIFIGSAAPQVWLNKEKYYIWLKQKYFKERFHYYPHRRENINDVIYSIPKKKIINLNKSFELFFLSLRNKPKKIISFPSTAIYFVRQFSGNQKIEMLSFSKIFKKNYFDLFNKEYLKQNKIYLFLKKII